MSDNERKDPGRILIIGGGTAGWMAAISFAHAWPQATITLLESDAIGIIGVGEGSTPKMRQFFRNLGISDAEWMPHCNGTYKCGIRFPGWSTRPNFETYYHPFFSASDDPYIHAFYRNVILRRENLDAHAHPDTFFISNYLSQNSRAPLPENTDYTSEYAYHFDARLIGDFLKTRAMARGVRHMVDMVTSVKQAESGEILGVETAKHGFVEADFFVDCSGFAGLLVGKALKVPFHSYQHFLFNDRAVAMPTPHADPKVMRSETLSMALKHGWVWKIPLTNRVGNGYVYSSAHVSAEDAERELRAYLKLPDDDQTEARHLKMRIGRLERHWEKNCLAVGLSQGFLEPLEATALMVVQETIEKFIETFALGPAHRDEFNDRINHRFDSIRDYIQMHYLLNTRTDTPYWVASRENTNMSDAVRHVIDVWDNDGDIVEEYRKGDLAYSPTSWWCILAGMGRFPKKPPRKPRKNIDVVDPKWPREACMKMLQHFPDHRTVVDAMGH